MGSIRGFCRAKCAPTSPCACDGLYSTGDGRELRPCFLFCQPCKSFAFGAGKIKNRMTFIIRPSPVGGERGIRTPGTRNYVRQFSKLLVSATHPSHQCPLKKAGKTAWPAEFLFSSENRPCSVIGTANILIIYCFAIFSTVYGDKTYCFR